MNGNIDYFSKINELLESTDYPVEIKDISDIEDFLSDVGNQQYEEYDEIGKIYDEMMENTEYEDE